jgi:c-di-GMP-binding flagellar brake protein YcgR
MKGLRSFQVYSREEYSGEERRRKPRINFPASIKIRTRCHSANRLEFETVAKDLSAGGFSACAPMECRPGQKLFFVVNFSLAKFGGPKAIKIAAYGSILRSSRRLNGSYKIASTITRYRFL